MIKDIWLNEWNRTAKDLKEIDEHVKESVVRVKTYEYYQPKSNVLLKHLEDIKKRKTIEQAKRKEETQKGKDAIRESNKKDRDR